MHVYTLFAHPGRDTFNREVLDSFARGLTDAGHTRSHLEETGIAESMRRIMLDDRLLGVGVAQTAMEILGGMMPGDDTHRTTNLERADALGRNL
jgi:NAD(P)H dehydrogenase (quinone)